MRNVNTSQEDPGGNVAGTLTIVLTSVLFLAVGLVMMLMPQMKLIYFSYGAGCILMICGIWFIARYFKNQEYKKITNYGFSAGTLIVILGCCTLIRAQDIADSVSTYLGILILIEGVVMLQGTVQLKNLKGDTWLVNLVFSLISIVCSIIVILDIASIISRWEVVLYVMLVVIGVFGLASFTMVAMRIKKYHKEQEREYKRNLEEARQMDVSQQNTSQMNDEDVTVVQDNVTMSEMTQDAATGADSDTPETIDALDSPDTQFEES